MKEAELIERYFASRVAPDATVVLGIGDDAAVVDCDADEQLVIATDTINVGTHFPDEMPARAVGHRCLAVNLSDLAAMAAKPAWCVLALSLPQADAAWLDEFSAGFFSLADRSGIGVIGGDTVRGPLAATVTVLGRVPRGKFVPRSGARAGDDLYVTGTPGDAAAGLGLLNVKDASPSAAVLRNRFCFPEPRLTAGLALRNVVGAMIDLSDGLHVDLHRMLKASGVGAELDAGLLPLSDALTDRLGRDGAIQSALTGGDDYELCFAAPPGRTADIEQLARDWSFPVTRIGQVVSSPDVNWSLHGGDCEIEAPGFEHFADRRADGP